MKLRVWFAIPVVASLLVVGGGIALAPRRASTKPAGLQAAALADRGMRFLARVKADADPSFYPRAEARFREALELDPRSFTALFGLATTALGRHDFAGGVRWARRAKAINADNSDAYGALGDGLLELGRYRAAEAAFQRMVDLRPGLPAFARISYARQLRGDTPGAIAAMRLAVRSAGNRDDAAWALFHVADLFLNSGRAERARAIYRRASELSPGTPGPLNGLAKAAAASGDIERAARLMDRVVRLSQEPGYAIYLGDLRAVGGNERAARAAYRLAHELEAAEEANGVNVNLEASLFAADHGHSDEALARAAAEHAARRSVHVADAHAWALFKAGRRSAALKASREAFRLGTRDPLFMFHRGMIERSLGHDAVAGRFLSRALRLNPAFSPPLAPVAKKALEGMGVEG